MSKIEEECGCNDDCPCKEEPVTQEDIQTNYDDWWNSLTNEQKQQLYNDQEEAFKLTIEEMNYERE
jgi:hypothetical protein